VKARYLAVREALRERSDEVVEITMLGGPRSFLSVAPTEGDFVACARSAYVRGDITLEEFESEVEGLL
jgi:hypothetical protein